MEKKVLRKHSAKCFVCVFEIGFPLLNKVNMGKVR